MSLQTDIVITATCSKCKEETTSIYSSSFKAPVKRAKKRRIGEGWFISKQVNLCPKCSREELDHKKITSGLWQREESNG
jgi:predicted nucleic-acid-binding Zn-ribbon protein